MSKVLVIGFGSIGKRHCKNLLMLGYKPIVYTKYPDETAGIEFIDDINGLTNIEYVIIASSTNRHLDDLKKILDLNSRYILLEKPVEYSWSRCMELENALTNHNVNVSIAYNLRFHSILQYLKMNIAKIKNDIRLVKIIAGQYLPEWRSYKNYKDSYSSYRDQGGGVDLDLSHEIDYMLWIFGKPVSIAHTIRRKISTLEIDSPDYFFGVYDYQKFLVHTELDYFRPKERCILIYGENEILVDVDFINNSMMFKGQYIQYGNDSMNETYIKELKEFLNITNRKYLSSFDEGLEVIQMLKLEE